MTISTINRDLAFETFQYLPEEEDVVNCGKVNRHWKQVIKENETKLFSEDFLAIKGARDTFIRTRHLLEAVNREIEALEDFFADPENQVGLLKIGLSSFSFVNEKCASYRDQMQLRIEKNELLGKLKIDSHRISCINGVELLTLKNLKNRPYMMKLFGGIEKYNKIPITHIRQILPYGKKFINCINLADMENLDPNASIVRGFDQYGNVFFTVKLRLVKFGNDTGVPFCATIFQFNSGIEALMKDKKSLCPLQMFYNEKEFIFFGLANLISTGKLWNHKAGEELILV